MPTTRTLIDSTSRYDARLLGYDAPCDPKEDADGLTVEIDTDGNLCIRTAEGYVELDPIAAEMLCSSFTLANIPKPRVSDAEYARTLNIQRGIDARRAVRS